MDQCTTDNGRIIYNMDMVSSCFQIRLCIKVTGKMGITMVKEGLFILMAMFMKVIGKRGNVMVLEHFSELIRVSILANGNIIRRLDLERKFLLMDLRLKVNI